MLSSSHLPLSPIAKTVFIRSSPETMIYEEGDKESLKIKKGESSIPTIFCRLLDLLQISLSPEMAFAVPS